MHKGKIKLVGRVTNAVGTIIRKIFAGTRTLPITMSELMKSMHQSSYSGTLIHLDSATAPGWPLPAGAVPSCSIQSIDNTIIQKLMCML